MALASKDLKYYWREPQFKRVMLSSLYLIIVLLLPLIGANPYGGTRQGSTQFVFAAALLLALNLTSFAFGYEGQAVTTLAIFPVRATSVFLGKNLAVLALAGVEMAILLGIQGAISHNWAMLPVYAASGLAGLLAALGLGNIIAILLPMRVARNRLGRPEGDSGTSSINGLIVFGAYTVALILLAPVGAALAVPLILSRADLFIILIPLAVLYGLGIYAGGTAIAAGMYYQRIPRIIEVVAKE
jgi:hypothetical protein